MDLPPSNSKPSSSSSSSSSSIKSQTVVEQSTNKQQQQLRVKKKTLQLVLEQALQSLRNSSDFVDEPDSGTETTDDSPSSSSANSETNELCDMLKSTVESPNFLEKLGSVHISIQQNMSEECSSWDIVNDTDLWEGGNIDGEIESDQESYVLVRQDDVVEGIACFMAAYLLSFERTKDLTPTQLQEALSKTFSLKKRKGKLRKAWDGSKVIYNVASWGATAVGEVLIELGIFTLIPPGYIKTQHYLEQLLWPSGIHTTLSQSFSDLLHLTPEYVPDLKLPPGEGNQLFICYIDLHLVYMHYSPK